MFRVQVELCYLLGGMIVSYHVCSVSCTLQLFTNIDIIQVRPEIQLVKNQRTSSLYTLVDLTSYGLPGVPYSVPFSFYPLLFRLQAAFYQENIISQNFSVSRVSTKWLNLLRKICAIFAQFFLRTFALFLRMKRNEFCAVLRYFFAQFAQNRKYFLRNVAHETKFQFSAIFFAQNRKFYAKCNFLGKLSKIDILTLELNN